MNRKVKIGIVGILLLSIMIPAAISSATTSLAQQVQQANQIVINAVEEE